MDALNGCLGKLISKKQRGAAGGVTGGCWGVQLWSVSWMNVLCFKDGRGAGRGDGLIGSRGMFQKLVLERCASGSDGWVLELDLSHLVICYNSDEMLSYSGQCILIYLLLNICGLEWSGHARIVYSSSLFPKQI